MLSKKVTLLSCVGLIFKRGHYVWIQGHFSLLQSQLAKRFTQCVSSLKLRHLTRNRRATSCILYAEYFYALRKNNAQWRSLKIDFTTKFLMDLRPKAQLPNLDSKLSALADLLRKLTRLCFM